MNLNISKEDDLSKLDAKVLIWLKSLRDHILNELIQKASDLRLSFGGYTMSSLGTDNKPKEQASLLSTLKATISLLSFNFMT